MFWHKRRRCWQSSLDENGRRAVWGGAAMHPQLSAIAATHDSLEEQRTAQLSNIAAHMSTTSVLITLRRGSGSFGRGPRWRTSAPPVSGVAAAAENS